MIRTSLLTTALVTSTLLATQAYAQNAMVVYPPVSEKAEHVITYTSGGIGEESQARMEQLENDYNLKVVTAYDTGHYLADIAMMVADQDGNVIINTMTDGPMFYADLEPGTYKVSAKYHDSLKSQFVTVSDAGTAKQVVFHWPATSDAVSNL